MPKQEKGGTPKEIIGANSEDWEKKVDEQGQEFYELKEKEAVKASIEESEKPGKIKKLKDEVNEKLEEEDLTLEKAKEIMLSYWTERLNRDKEVTAKTVKDLSLAERHYGTDFDIARCKAFIGKINAEDFFSEFDIVGTYDGEFTSQNEPSIYDFYKGVVSSRSELKKAGASEKLIEATTTIAEEQEAVLIVKAIEGAKGFSSYQKNKNAENN